MVIQSKRRRDASERERGRKRQRNGRWGGERREEKEREESVPRRQNSTSMKMANGLPPQFINKIKF